MITRLNDKQKFIATGVVLAVVFSGLGTMNYLKFAERREHEEQINRYTAEEQAATAKIKQIPELRERRAKLIENLDTYVGILPREEHVQHEAFMEIIDSYRKDSKIVIQKAEYVKIKEDEKAPKKDNFIRHRYKFKLLGTVPDFVDFVSKVENHTRFLKVDAINIRPLGVAEEMGSDSDERGDGGSPADLSAATDPIKEIDLTVSTYTYSRGEAKKV